MTMTNTSADAEKVDLQALKINLASPIVLVRSIQHNAEDINEVRIAITNIHNYANAVIDGMLANVRATAERFISNPEQLTKYEKIVKQYEKFKKDVTKFKLAVSEEYEEMIQVCIKANMILAKMKNMKNNLQENVNADETNFEQLTSLNRNVVSYASLKSRLTILVENLGGYAMRFNLYGENIERNIISYPFANGGPPPLTVNNLFQTLGVSDLSKPSDDQIAESRNSTLQKLKNALDRAIVANKPNQSNSVLASAAANNGGSGARFTKEEEQAMEIEYENKQEEEKRKRAQARKDALKEGPAQWLDATNARRSGAVGETEEGTVGGAEEGTVSGAEESQDAQVKELFRQIGNRDMISTVSNLIDLQNTDTTPSAVPVPIPAPKPKLKRAKTDTVTKSNRKRKRELVESAVITGGMIKSALTQSETNVDLDDMGYLDALNTVGNGAITILQNELTRQNINLSDAQIYDIIMGNEEFYTFVEDILKPRYLAANNVEMIDVNDDTYEFRGTT